MVKRQWILAGVIGAVALCLGLYAWLGSTPTVSTVSAEALERAAAPGSQLPRIGLGRLSTRPQYTDLGHRDIFDFAAPPPPPPQIASAESESDTAPPPSTVATPPPPPPPPPLNVKYIGSLEAKSQKGPRVAFFLTEPQKEVLSGQVGETVMNRFRVVRIGIESVDVADLAAGGQVRRLPMKGN